MIALADGKALWYLTRGSSAVCLILVTATMVLGIASYLGSGGRRTPRFVIQGLHRNVSLVSMVFLVIHVATVVLDGYTDIGWIDAVVPGQTPYRTVWVGLGAVSTDLMLAIIATSLLRSRVSLQVWRTVHWASYASWPIAVAHGLGAGSDTHERWMMIVVGICIMAVAAALTLRLKAQRSMPGAVRLTG